MIRASLLAKWKISKTNFTKFVKADPLKRSSMDVATALNARWGKLAEKAEDDDYDFDDGGGGAAQTCCGVWEIGDLSEVEELEIALIKGLLKGYRGFVYYSINSRLTNAAKRMGFHETMNFVNHNTGNNIAGLSLTVWEKK